MTSLVTRSAVRAWVLVVLVPLGTGLTGCGKDRSRHQVKNPSDQVRSAPEVVPDGAEELPETVEKKAQPILDVTFNDVKFEIEKGGKFERSMLPDKINQMVGRKLRIRGFMLSSIHRQGLSRFILLQNSNCPFGGPEAYLYHNIQVDLAPGITTSFTVNPVTVEGVFSIRPLPGLEDEHLSIYHIQGEKIY